MEDYLSIVRIHYPGELWTFLQVFKKINEARKPDRGFTIRILHGELIEGLRQPLGSLVVEVLELSHNVARVSIAHDPKHDLGEEEKHQDHETVEDYCNPPHLTDDAIHSIWEVRASHDLEVGDDGRR